MLVISIVTIMSDAVLMSVDISEYPPVPPEPPRPEERLVTAVVADGK